jgi:hypothetical protein
MNRTEKPARDVTRGTGSVITPQNRHSAELSGQLRRFGDLWAVLALAVTALDRASDAKEAA